MAARLCASTRHRAWTHQSKASVLHLLLPAQADGTGAKLVAPAAPAGTNLAAQFSITWEDVPPSKIGELQAAAFKAAILKQLPSGGLVGRQAWQHWPVACTAACTCSVGPAHASVLLGLSPQGRLAAPAFFRRGRVLHHHDHGGCVVPLWQPLARLRGPRLTWVVCSAGLVAGVRGYIQSQQVCWAAYACLKLSKQPDAAVATAPYMPCPTHSSAAHAATVAKSSGKTSQGGSVWPPGQPTTVKSGRLVFNTNIHGTTFNAVAGKAALTKFMDVLRTNTAVVFPPRAFGRLALEPGYGVRLVNSPAFPCACQGGRSGSAGGTRWQTCIELACVDTDLRAHRKQSARPQSAPCATCARCCRHDQQTCT